ncbi:SDR family NAD(P)-dependent oxidoreductase [Bradyrhizobium sp.]|uniref:SDR family NAD(P)-dependent oxidoreductase n=1 Tax=Bradyrhizobium sp. TaxID=376 RepID=UPI0023A5436B|nr:SDR family NAD(P)-dependent oxidoreductase [Bradyrhizobium sp.]MDE2378825.1 SDR family oxidoreductase [Bradyrhizobium sp.]
MSTRNSSDLAGKVALVSGAARGIGRAIALRLAKAGADVGLVDINPAVEETARLVRETGRKACIATADISDGTAAREAAARVAAELAPVDLLVNNAGIVNNIAPVEKMSDEAWQREVGVNLTGAFNLVRATVASMAARGFGRIVNISSVAARGGLARQVGYSATKAGLLGLTHTVALEYARKGVTCNAVLPGMVETENVKAMPAEIREEAMAMTPACRFGEPEEIAALVAFLCGPEAGYITGAEIDISGGGHLNSLVLGSRRELKK